MLVIFANITLLFQSDGQDVLKSKDLCQHWLRYKEEYAAFPTTTHYVERSVKISNFCKGSSQSRSEERSSQFAICYNIVHDVNDMAKEEMIIERHNNKESTYKNEDKLIARGKSRQKTALHTVVQRHMEIGRAMEDGSLSDTYTCIEKKINIKSKSFRSERQQREYDINVSKSSKVRKGNQIERMKGFDVTAAMANKIRFSAATKPFEDGINLELNARGVNSLDSFKNFTDKKTALKKLCAKEEDIQLKECTHFNIKSSYDWMKIESKNK